MIKYKNYLQNIVKKNFYFANTWQSNNYDRKCFLEGGRLPSKVNVGKFPSFGLYQPNTSCLRNCRQAFSKFSDTSFLGKKVYGWQGGKLPAFNYVLNNFKNKEKSFLLSKSAQESGNIPELSNKKSKDLGLGFTGKSDKNLSGRANTALAPMKVKTIEPYKNNCVNKEFLQFFLYSFCSQNHQSKFISLNQPFGEGGSWPPVSFLSPKSFYPAGRRLFPAEGSGQRLLPSEANHKINMKPISENHSNTSDNFMKEPSYLVAQIVSSFSLCQPSTTSWLFQAFPYGRKFVSGKFANFLNGSHDSKTKSLKSFFPYRKAFLSYWLCPFVGFMYTLQSFNGMNLNSSLETNLQRSNLNNSISSSYFNLFLGNSENLENLENLQTAEFNTLTKKQQTLMMYPIPLNKKTAQLNSKEEKDSSFIVTGTGSQQAFPLELYKNSRWNRLPIQYFQNNQSVLNKERLSFSNSKTGFVENCHLTVNSSNLSEPFILKMSLFHKSLNTVLDNSYNSENPKTSFKKASFLLDNFVKQNLLFVAKGAKNEKTSQKLTNGTSPFFGGKATQKAFLDSYHLNLNNSDYSNSPDNSSKNQSFSRENKLTKKDMYKLLSTVLKTSLNNNFSLMKNKKESWNLPITETFTKTVNNKVVSILFNDLKIPVMNELGVLPKSQKNKRYLKNLSGVGVDPSENMSICSNYSLPVLLNLEVPHMKSTLLLAKPSLEEQGLKIWSNNLNEVPTNVENKADPAHLLQEGTKEELIKQERLKKIDGNFPKTNILKYSHPLFMSGRDLEVKTDLNVFNLAQKEKKQFSKIGFIDDLKIRKEIQLKSVAIKNSNKFKEMMNPLFLKQTPTAENEYKDFTLFINFYKQRVKEFMQYLNFSNLIHSGSFKTSTNMHNTDSSLISFARSPGKFPTEATFLPQNQTILDKKDSPKNSEKQWSEKVLRAFFSTKKVEVNTAIAMQTTMQEKMNLPKTITSFSKHVSANSKRSESVYNKFKSRILNKKILNLVKMRQFSFFLSPPPTGYLKEGTVKLFQKCPALRRKKGAISNILNNSHYFVQSKGLSPLLLIKNRFILLDKDLKNESLLEKLSFEKTLLDRKNEQKKRRRKKLKKETRVRKKRKRFYPRPLWMRYRLYTNFLKKRYLLGGEESSLPFFDPKEQNIIRNTQKNKSLISVNTKSYDVSPFLQKSSRPKVGMGFLSAGSKDKNCLSPLVSSFGGKSKNVLLDLNSNKSFYTISYSVLGDLKRVLWKSYWLRSNLKPYLTKVKNMLNEMKVYKQSQVEPFSQNVRKLMSSLLYSDQDSSLREELSHQSGGHAGKKASKWQNVLYLAEYDRITYGRLQHYLSQIRENVNVFGQNKIRLYHLGHSNSASLLRKRKKDIARQNSSDLWVKLGKTLMTLAEGDSQFSYLQNKNPLSPWWTGCFLPFNLQNITVPQLRMYWALSKTNYSSFTNKDVGFYTSIGKQQSWNTTKAREQTKNNKTKKLAYQLSAKLQSFLNKQKELLTYLHNNYVPASISTTQHGFEGQESLPFWQISPSGPSLLPLQRVEGSKKGENLPAGKGQFKTTSRNSTIVQDLDSTSINNRKKSLVLFEKSLNKIRLKEEKALYFGFRHTSEKMRQFVTSPDAICPPKEKNKNIYSTKTKAFKSPLSYAWTAQLSNKSSYWWDSPLKGWAHFNFVSQNEGTRGKLHFSLNTVNNKSHFIEMNNSFANSLPFLSSFPTETPLNLAKPFWISSLLFHFCTLLSLLSLSQIRSLFKVYMIVFSKLYKNSKSLLNFCVDTLSTMNPFLTDSTELKTNPHFSPASAVAFKNGRKSRENEKTLLPFRKVAAGGAGGQLSTGRDMEKFAKFSKTGHFFLIEQRFYSFLESLLLKTANTELLSNSTKLEKTQDQRKISSNIWTYFFFRYFIQKPIFIYKKIKSSFNSGHLMNTNSPPLLFSSSSYVGKDDNDKQRSTGNLPEQIFHPSKKMGPKGEIGQTAEALKTYTTLYSLLLLNFILSKGYGVYSTLASVLAQTVETIGVSAPRSVFSFFEKPGELILDWIAYMFLVEWASDIINTLPETMDSYVGASNYKFLRTIQSIQVVTSFGLGLDLTRNFLVASTSQNSPIHLLTNPKTLSGNSLQLDHFSSVFMDSLNIGSTLIQRRVYFLYEILLFSFYQPDADLISRQKKGVIFWDIWGDFLTQVAEDSNINISELTSVKEEQMKLLEKCAAWKFADSSNFDNVPSSEAKQAKNPGTTVSNPQFLSPLPFGGNFTAGRKTNFGRRKLVGHPEKGSEKRTGLPMPKVHESIQGAQQFLSYQGKDSELFIDLHPPKNFGIVNVLNFNESVQQPVGSLVCQIFSGLLSKQISKNILVVGSTGPLKGPGGNHLLAEQKTLLVQAIAGETELKIITDNAYRYAMVYRGVAVGIKLLRDVFDSLALHTPCLFLIEDIHAIGERRPLLMSDDETTKGTTSFGSQREEVHEKNQILYQLSKHVTTHYRKPYKGDFSLLIPTNHFCFDLFRGSALLKNKLNQSGEKTLAPRILTNSVGNLPNASQQTTSTFDPTENKSNNSSAQSNTRLLMTKSELLSPPAYSPFSLLTLKEEKKFKAHKVVSEIPWSGYPGESLAQISAGKASYSIRVKVALLADMAISSLSVKLDMITDLLVIIDSVKGNRGFVVFATTHVPYILDPALRRPGRLDETITLASFPTLSSRWEILKSLFYQSASSSKGYFLGPTRGFSEQSGFNKGSTLDQSSVLLTSSFTIQSFSKNLQKFISTLPSVGCLSNPYGPGRRKEQEKNPKLMWQEGKLPPSTSNNFEVKQKSWLHSQKSQSLTLVRTKKSSKLFKDDSLVALNPTIIYNDYMNHTKNHFINKEESKKAARQLSAGGKSLPLLSLATSRKIVAQTYFKSSLMISKANLFFADKELFDVPFTNTTETSAFYLSFYSPQPSLGTLPLGNSPAGNMRSSVTSFENSSNVLKKSIIQLLSGKLGEMIYFSKQSKLSLSQRNLQNTSYPARLWQEGTNLTKTPFLNTSGIYTSYSLNTLQSLSSLVLSFLQKRFIYHKFLSFPGFLSFSNNNPLMEASSPPLSNILLPSRRYENYKRSLQFYSGTKNSLGITEKINFHQQQRLVKRLYRYPVQEKFRSEIIENRLTGFSNASLMIGSLSDNLQKQSRSNFFLKKNILNRHRNYLTNQWWNGQLPEHNSETTFLSDIDWRYTFSESVGDLLLDFPDAEQYYNPRQRRWLLSKNAYSNYFDFDKKLYHEVYSHFIFESFNNAYKLYENNRENLDYASFNLLRNGLHYTLNEYESFKLYKRFFKNM